MSMVVRGLDLKMKKMPLGRRWERSRGEGGNAAIGGYGTSDFNGEHYSHVMAAQGRRFCEAFKFERTRGCEIGLVGGRSACDVMIMSKGFDGGKRFIAIGKVDEGNLNIH